MTGVVIEDFELDEDTHLITVAGDVDVYAAPELKDRIDRAQRRGAHNLLIQFADGTFIDSTILGVLLGTLREFRSHARTLRVVCADPALIRIFTLTGLDRTFPIHTRLEDALQRHATAAQSGNGGADAHASHARS